MAKRQEESRERSLEWEREVEAEEAAREAQRVSERQRPRDDRAEAASTSGSSSFASPPDPGGAYAVLGSAAYARAPRSRSRRQPTQWQPQSAEGGIKDPLNVGNGPRQLAVASTHMQLRRAGDVFGLLSMMPGADRGTAAGGAGPAEQPGPLFPVGRGGNWLGWQRQPGAVVPVRRGGARDVGRGRWANGPAPVAVPSVAGEALWDEHPMEEQEEEHGGQRAARGVDVEVEGPGWITNDEEQQQGGARQSRWDASAAPADAYIDW
jgi:hypothetical protein